MSGSEQVSAALLCAPMSTAPSTSRRTFLFTDIESSTRLWDLFPDAMLGALDQHDQVVLAAITAAGGALIRHTGDGVVVVFDHPAAAVRAAVDAQHRLGAVHWGAVGSLTVRMGVHTGDVVLRGGEHHGWALNVASRLHALAHGGQVVVSDAAMADVRPGELRDVWFADLGLRLLRDVAEPIRVYEAVSTGSAPHADGLRESARQAVSVPRPLTSFVGRADDLRRVSTELDRHQVVTLTGIAGTGKTRLAIEVALRAADGFRDGVAICELAGVDSSQVGVALAKALGVERRSLRSAEESVLEWLHDKELLLVIDTCEESPDATRALVHAISLGCAGVRVLATGHEPLSIDAEQVIRLSPLGADDAGSDAVELFRQRAGGVGADLADSPEVAASVLEICRAVDGLPLAIEIAASNAGSLSLRDILDAIRAGELLGARHGAAGHRSVLDALDLTFGRLNDRERDAVTRCAVFVGSFDRAAFATVAVPSLDGSDVFDVLRSLVDRSLVTSETRRERTRFRLLEPVRAYAIARCDADALAASRAAFVAHHVERAEAAADALRGPEEARWVTQIELDFDNLRAAHRRSLEGGDAEASLRIVAALWDFAFMRMRSEIFDWGEEALAVGGDHPARAMVMGVVALGGWLREHPAKATSFANDAIRLERDSGLPPSIPARMALMNSAEYGGAAVDVRALMAEVMDATRRIASPYWQVNADVLRVLSYAFSGRVEPAEAMADAAMATARRSENPSTVAWAFFAKGMAVELTDVDHAESLFEDGLERARSVENGWIGAMCSTRLASLRRRRGSARDAMALVAELVDTWDRAGHRAHLWAAIRQAALCLAEVGDDEHAVVLLEAASLATLQAPQLPVEAVDDRACIDRLRARVDPAEWRRRASRGGGMGADAAMRVARERIELALAR